jgi:hypothetical protein
MARLLGALAKSRSVNRRVRLEFVGTLVLALCLAACAGGGSTSTSQATSSVTSLPTATSQSSSGTSTPQPSSTTSTTPTTGPATPTSQTAQFCSDLSTFYQAITSKQGEVLVTMSISTTIVIHAGLKQYTSQPVPTMSGAGYIVAPNDAVNLKVTQSANSVAVSVNDTVKRTDTTYSVSHCSASTSSVLRLTGSSPATFTADIVWTAPPTPTP